MNKNKEVIDSVLSKMQIIKDEKNYIYLYGPVNLPITLNNSTEYFQWYTWFSDSSYFSKEDLLLRLPYLNQSHMQINSILIKGDFKNSNSAKVRFHSICHTGDIFNSEKCDCGSQLQKSLKRINDYGSGALFYIANHEGRGIGLFSKCMAYSIQEQGFNTVDANLLLGYQEEQRNYHESIQILKFLREKPIILLTNNPNKIDSLSQSNIQIEKTENVFGIIKEHNQKYIKTKKELMKHTYKECKYDTYRTN